MHRILIGWLLGMALVPGVAQFRFWAGAQSSADAEALRFALVYVWPAFMLAGLTGFYLARIKSSPARAVSFLVAGAIAGAAVAVGAPALDSRLRGNELQLLAHLTLDGLFCFAVFWYVAIGLGSVKKQKLMNNAATQLLCFCGLCRAANLTPNPSFEPTCSGKAQLPVISFWVNCALPPQAAQLKR